MKNKVLQERKSSLHKPLCYSIFYRFVFQARRSHFLEHISLIEEELKRLSQTHGWSFMHACTQEDKLILVVCAEPYLSPLRIVKVVKGALGKKLKGVVGKKKVWEEGYEVATLTKFP